MSTSTEVNTRDNDPEEDHPTPSTIAGNDAPGSDVSLMVSTGSSQKACQGYRSYRALIAALCTFFVVTTVIAVVMFSTGNAKGVASAIQSIGGGSGGTSSGSSSGGGGGSGSCFSADTTVQTLKGPVPMKDLQVGDKILTAQGKYEHVYAFGHYLPNGEAEFLVIETEGNSQLEITPEHLLYRQGTSHPVPAYSLRVGDKIQPHGAEVTMIDSVHKTGIYAPLVSSGSFLVNHGSVKVSSYISLVQAYSTGYAHFADGTPFLPQHTGIHMVLTPYRMICTTFSGYCQGSYTQEGMPPHVANGIEILTWADKLPLMEQVVLLVLALVAFGALMVVEKIGLVLLAATFFLCRNGLGRHHK
ncbi:Warthog protein [Seminavis robusta]|uniref:Warthog protein n=1 Tax=Seminavis robusta TaxID=568900 RepID=A0A9N8E3F0_9STRA|nr:Warthog protein [Seminavis robusta]|eukprot:Sro579_g169900.1 Warthog protein (358) ;mRNA; f:1315-2388